MDIYSFEEVRDAETRNDEQFSKLREVLTFALDHAPGLAARVSPDEIAELKDRDALAKLPVLRKSELTGLQTPEAPLGGLAVRQPNHFRWLFMSPGPIFEPGSDARDAWRLARFIHASGIGMGDIVQNCFSYHLTPAGHMFDSAVAAVSATVIPAGTGQTEQQVAVAAHYGATAYGGTPDYLKVILEAADDMGVKLGITKAVVSGGALFPSLKSYYTDRGITTRQCYATADAGLIAYETAAEEGMVVDERTIVEIVTPGTGDPVPEGEVGEVVVTVISEDYPLLRFGTGDLSAVMPGQSPCGRTNMRLKGWMGRADQTTKVKGMFIRPEQVATLVARHDEVARARVVVTREDERDILEIKIEAEGIVPEAVAATAQDVLKLKADVKIVAPGDLPRDGIVIEDKRSYD